MLVFVNQRAIIWSPPRFAQRSEQGLVQIQGPRRAQGAKISGSTHFQVRASARRPERTSGNVPGIESEPADLHHQLRDELPFSTGPASSAT